MLFFFFGPSCKKVIRPVVCYSCKRILRKFSVCDIEILYAFLSSHYSGHCFKKSFITFFFAQVFDNWKPLCFWCICAWVPSPGFRWEDPILSFLERNFNSQRSKLLKVNYSSEENMKDLESSHKSSEMFARRLANCRNEIKGMEINGSFTPNVLKMSKNRSTFSLL